MTRVDTSVQTLLCGLLGLPPSNGVLPQSPMHTKSLAILKKQVNIIYLSMIVMILITMLPLVLLH